jgi:excisionase family DNA binding protein
MRKDEILQNLRRIKIMLKRQQRKPLTIQEASRYTGLSSSFLYKLTSKNEISFYKPNGKKIYFLKRDLDRYILRVRIKSKEEQKKFAIDVTFNMSNKRNKMK